MNNTEIVPEFQKKMLVAKNILKHRLGDVELDFFYDVFKNVFEPELEKGNFTFAFEDWPKINNANLELYVKKNYPYQMTKMFVTTNSGTKAIFQFEKTQN